MILLSDPDTKKKNKPPGDESENTEGEKLPMTKSLVKEPLKKLVER